MSLRFQHAGVTDPVALAFAVVAFQQQNRNSSTTTMDANTQPGGHSEFECASLDAVLSRGGLDGGRDDADQPGHSVQMQVLPHQLNHFFHHYHQGEQPQHQQQDHASGGNDNSERSHHHHHHHGHINGNDHDDHDNDDDDDDHDDDDYEKRMVRSRERNREHARRTRLRKKAQLELLRTKAKTLEAERVRLKQQIEECSIASILIGLTGDDDDDDGNAHNDPLADEETKKLLVKNDSKSAKVASLTKGKRKRFVSDAAGDDVAALDQPPLQVEINGETKYIGTGKANINWKTGVYSDDTGAHSKLSAEQLENLRRERNRMHAKMTRDRKKCYVATIEKTVDELESDICRLKEILAKVQEAQAAAAAAAAAPCSDSPSLGPTLPVAVPNTLSPKLDTQITVPDNLLALPGNDDFKLLKPSVSDDSQATDTKGDAKIPVRKTFAPHSA